MSVHLLLPGDLCCIFHRLTVHLHVILFGSYPTGVLLSYSRQLACQWDIHRREFRQEKDEYLEGEVL